TGSPFPSPATPLVVEIPSPTDPAETATVDEFSGTPTGQVANFTLSPVFATTPAFFIDGSGPALFIFATEDGTIEAWNLALTDPDSPPGLPDDAVIVRDNSGAGAVYKGLALATRTVGADPKVPFLYATNFNTGNIDVFDGTFSPTTVPGT